MLLVKFFNKNLKDEIVDPVQLDKTSDILSLTSLLNMVLNKSSSYLFYYKSERIQNSLEFIAEKYGMNGEDIVEIGYIDERDLKSDYELDCNDTVIGLEMHNDELYYLEFNGSVNSKSGNFKYDSNRIKGIFSGATLFGFSEHAVVFDLIDKKEVCRFEQIIRSASFDAESSLMAVSTSDAVFCIDYRGLDPSNQLDHTLSSIKTDNKIVRNILILDKTIYWMEDHNKIIAYNIETSSKKVYSSTCCLNNFVVCNPELVFATTSNQKIVRFCGKECTEIDVCSRLSNFLIYHNGKLIFSTQHEVISLDAESMHEASFFKVKGQINSLKASNSMLYIANDCRIDGIAP